MLTGISLWKILVRQCRLGHHCISWALLVALLLSPLMPDSAAPLSLAPREDRRSLWTHLRLSFSLNHHTDHPHVRYWIKWYQQHPEAIERYIRDSRPWLYYVFYEVDRRHVPGEIALLPFIESGYNPRAQSASGAHGLWQLTAQAASDVNLVLTPTYDPRHDPIASTRAALDYFQWLSANWYGNDWILMLAVYNAGVGRVNKAIHDRHTRDFFKLSLPSETRHYVPRLLALAAIINAPDNYGVKLPEVVNEPTFMSVTLSQDIVLDSLTPQASPGSSTLRDFNPAYQHTVERHQALLIPINLGSSVICQLKAHAALADMARFPCPRHDALSAMMP